MKKYEPLPYWIQEAARIAAREAKVKCDDINVFMNGQQVGRCVGPVAFRPASYAYGGVVSDRMATTWRYDIPTINPIDVQSLYIHTEYSRYIIAHAINFAFGRYQRFTLMDHDWLVDYDAPVREVTGIFEMIGRPLTKC